MRLCEIRASGTYPLPSWERVTEHVTRSKTLPLRRAAHDLPFLDALALEHLGRDHVALGIDRDVVHPEELPGLAAEAPVGADHLAVDAAHHPQPVVAAVHHDQKALLLGGPQVEVPDRARERRRQIDLLAHER